MRRLICWWNGHTYVQCTDWLALTLHDREHWFVVCLRCGPRKLPAVPQQCRGYEQVEGR